MINKGEFQVIIMKDDDNVTMPVDFETFNKFVKEIGFFWSEHNQPIA